MYANIAFDHVILRTYGWITFKLEFLKLLLNWFVQSLYGRCTISGCVQLKSHLVHISYNLSHRQ